jgi:hypothetical protein
MHRCADVQRAFTRIVAADSLLVLVLLAFSTGCGGGPPSTPTQPQSQPVSVSLSPSNSNVLLGNTQQFVATVSGSSNTAVTWNVNGVVGGNSTVGMVSSSGLYMAPGDLPTSSTISVTATSQADTSKSASASVVVGSDISLTISTNPPSAHSLSTGSTLQLTATISSSGHPDSTVIWTVNGQSGGSATYGSIVATGPSTATYTAPTTAPTPNVVTLGAISMADPTKSVNSVVGVFTLIIVASSTIGTAGGNILVTDATSPLVGTQVVVPIGALTQDTLITISSVSPLPTIAPPFEIRGSFVDLGPAGLQFGIPASIALPSTSPDFTDRSDLEYTYTGTGFRPLSQEDEAAESHGQVFDSVSKRISSLTTHFSIDGVLGRPDIESDIANSTGTLGSPINVPVDATQCIRCVQRTVPISQIIIHSTNDGGAPFPSIIAWIHGSIGDDTPNANGKPKEAFFATYYIDKQGRIVQLVPEDIQTSHIANHNTGTIGIEVYDGNSPYTANQVQALVLLVTRIMQTYGVSRDNVFRHKDYSQGDPNHQDPYKWQDTDWVKFKSSLPATSNSFTLTVATNGTGNGTVTSSPTGLSCDTTCSAAAFSFPAGAVVTLVAVPESGSTFVGWSGACSGNSGCMVTMGSDQAVSATFSALTATYVGTFSGIIVDQGSGGCPGAATTSGPGTVTVTESSSPFAFDGMLTLSQGAGICDDYSGTYGFSGTFDPTTGGPVTFSFGLGTATGTFSGNVFSGTWTFTAGPGPDVANGTFSLVKQ